MLSGGEQQRVAIAVSLANNPDLLLADEPTGEVDNQTAAMIYEVLHHLNHERGLTVIIVTHDRGIAHLVDRVVAIRDGRTSTETVCHVDSFRAGSTPHAEYVIVDDVGRLQLPDDYIKELGISDRVTVGIEEGRLVVRPESGANTVAKPPHRPGKPTRQRS